LEEQLSNGKISVRINGEARFVPAGLNVLGLLEWLGIEADRVAVELNRHIIRKQNWASTPVDAEAEVEIVMFVGGGKV
jgi:thiamine biosynthesis protein ThiS